MVYVILANGFEEIEALTQVDYLRRAGLTVCTVSVGEECVIGSHNIPVLCDMTVQDIEPEEDGLEMIVLPGGLGGVDGMKKSKAVSALIDYCVKHDIYIAAICAAPTILAKAGLLRGKHAVCYPSMLGQLSECSDTSGRVAIDGKIITAAAAGVSEEFSFALIEALLGKDAAEKVRESIVAR